MLFWGDYSFLPCDEELHYFRLDELLIQAIQSKAQSPTIGCQLATALWKTASELSPSGLVRVKRRTSEFSVGGASGWLVTC